MAELRRGDLVEVIASEDSRFLGLQGTIVLPNGLHRGTHTLGTKSRGTKLGYVVKLENCNRPVVFSSAEIKLIKPPEQHQGCNRWNSDPLLRQIRYSIKGVSLDARRKGLKRLRKDLMEDH